MDFRLVHLGWKKELDAALQADSSIVRIICPFIKSKVVECLFCNRGLKKIQIITRFNLGDFSEFVSDISALHRLLKAGAEIRGIRNLHAKLYLFGMGSAIITSANLTDAAFNSNHELGFVVSDSSVVKSCHKYFDNLWNKAGENLSKSRLKEFEAKVSQYLATKNHNDVFESLKDEGIKVDIWPEHPTFPIWVPDIKQAFVKFFGEGNSRADGSAQILDEIKRSGCHWACAYPKDRRPRQVKDGAVMFMGRMIKEPRDIMIFGRAIGIHYVENRDDASGADIALRPWKAKWPHYVRVHHAEFIAGILSNGVSLNEMMQTLKSNAFVSTKRNAISKSGNIDPRKAYMQQPSVELSKEGISWINKQFEIALEEHGTIKASELAQLD